MLTEQVGSKKSDIIGAQVLSASTADDVSGELSSPPFGPSFASTRNLSLEAELAYMPWASEFRAGRIEVAILRQGVRRNERS